MQVTGTLDGWSGTQAESPRLTRVWERARPWLRDPRHYQIAMLTGFVIYGLAAFDFNMPWWMQAITVGSAIGFQYGFTKLFALPRFDPRSPLISSLSLCLLLRTNHWWMAVVAAGLTIGSKFLIRWRGQHVFNPTNFGIAVLLLLTSGDLFPALLPAQLIWVSPGQWGSGANLAFLFGCLGFLVAFRAERMDVSIAFLAWFALLVYGLAFYLGDPAGLPNRRMLNGALFLFAFFMISDPKTTPDSRLGRIVFAGIVALIACELQFDLSYTAVAAFGVEAGWWWQLQGHSIFYALLFTSLFLPVINIVSKGQRYEWPGREGGG